MQVKSLNEILPIPIAQLANVFAKLPQEMKLKFEEYKEAVKAQQQWKFDTTHHTDSSSIVNIEKSSVTFPSINVLFTEEDLDIELEKHRIEELKRQKV